MAKKKIRKIQKIIKFFLFILPLIIERYRNMQPTYQQRNKRRIEYMQSIWSSNIFSALQKKQKKNNKKQINVL